MAKANTKSVLAPVPAREQESQPTYRPFRKRVSEKFKAKRRELGWTLDKLASEIVLQSKNEIQSISTAHLSRIENDLARPSDEEMYWINIVLGAPLGTLLDDEPEPAWFIVRRSPVESLLDDIKSGRAQNVRHEGAHKEMVEARLYRYVPLDLQSTVVAPDDKSATRLEPENRVALLEVEHFEKDDERLDGHAGQEAVFCLDGELEFCQQSTQGGEPLRITLAPGDFIRFDSRQPHGFRARSSEPVRALHVVSTVQLKMGDAAVTVKVS